MTQEKAIRFPEGFLWGTAVCSHQAEGNNVNSDWWEFEQNSGKIKDGSVSGAACDIWNRYIEDFDYMRDIGLNAFRMSVEWARIEPRRGEWDLDALAHYADMLRALKDRGLSVCLTLMHFVLPKWVADAGGWAWSESPSRFRAYVKRVVEALGGYVDIWCTLNEPMGPIIAGYLVGAFPPQKINPLQAAAAFKNMLRGHAQAAEVIRGHAQANNAPAPPIGIAMALIDIEPVHPQNVIENTVAGACDFIHNKAFLDAMTTGKVPFPFGMGETIPGLAGSFNYIGAQYYTRSRLNPKPRLRLNPEFTDILYLPPGAETTEMGYEVYPPGLYRCLMDISSYGVPIYITENGIADATDHQRPRYILTHLAQAQRAIRDGADIRGYFYWTYIDNFEWLEGWRTKFGLVAMDPVTLDRKPRPSAKLYSEIARANGITHDMLERFAPEAYDAVFNI
jgi:beta-glucosidase